LRRAIIALLVFRFFDFLFLASNGSNRRLSGIVIDHDSFPSDAGVGLQTEQEQM
jgi:hypothetical protein